MLRKLPVCNSPAPQSSCLGECCSWSWSMSLPVSPVFPVFVVNWRAQGSLESPPLPLKHLKVVSLVGLSSRRPPMTSPSLRQCGAGNWTLGCGNYVLERSNQSSDHPDSSTWFSPPGTRPWKASAWARRCRTHRRSSSRCSSPRPLSPRNLSR